MRSPGGTISVRTTERGLPVALHLEAVELAKPPEQLARDIMALCRLSAARAQVARRNELVENGFSASVIRNLNLATDEDLERAEHEAMGEDDELPVSWRKTV
ncbi:hypothetical protein ACRCUN_32100 [Mycobacterium sp. LTG2003]